MSLMLAGLLIGCQPVIPSEPMNSSPTAQPARTRLPSTATLAASIQGPSLLRDASGHLVAAGAINNESKGAVQDLSIQLDFLDEDGALLASIETTPAPASLPAGGRAHFIGPFNSEGQPHAVQAKLTSFQPAQSEMGQLDLRLEAILPSNDGGSRVIGFITNNGRQTRQLDSFSIVGQQQDAIFSLPARTVVPEQIPARQTIPWQAEFEHDLSSDQLDLIALGHTGGDQSQCPLELSLEPGFQLDPQGQPFFSGLLNSLSQEPCLARALLLIRYDRKVLELVPLESAVPLAPGEQRAFGFRLRGVTPNLQPGNFSINPFFESSAQPNLAVLALDLELTSVENLGSNLFLQGQVTNPNEQVAQQGTLFGALRATDGSLLSAAWQDLPPDLAPGASHEFVLALPINTNMSIGTAEFDLRALGRAIATSSER